MLSGVYTPFFDQTYKPGQPTGRMGVWAAAAEPPPPPAGAAPSASPVGFISVRSS